MVRVTWATGDYRKVDGSPLEPVAPWNVSGSAIQPALACYSRIAARRQEDGLTVVMEKLE